MDYVGACPKHDPHHHKAYSEPKESSPQIHLATRTRESDTKGIGCRLLPRPCFSLGSIRKRNCDGVIQTRPAGLTNLR